MPSEALTAQRAAEERLQRARYAARLARARAWNGLSQSVDEAIVMQYVRMQLEAEQAEEDDAEDDDEESEEESDSEQSESSEGSGESDGLLDPDADADALNPDVRPRSARAQVTPPAPQPHLPASQPHLPQPRPPHSLTCLTILPAAAPLTSRAGRRAA